MVRRLCILCFLVALWPGLALAQSAALMDAFNQYKALNAQGLPQTSGTTFSLPA